MWPIALAALALVVAGGGVRAAALDDIENLYRRAEALIQPWVRAPSAGQSDLIVPHADIDPGMTIAPPNIGARMPAIVPPGTLDRPR